jgi:hypothetical protein
MKCQYCKEEKKLIKAHILAESFFRFMYPEGKVEGEALVMIAENKDYTSRRRIGYYDDQILCSECDGILGLFDEYGKEIFLETEPVAVKGVEVESPFVFENTDPQKLKLFLLSLLWRFAISTLPETRNVNLPVKFINHLEQMLKVKDPGGVHDFSMVITRFGFKSPERELHKYFQMPVQRRRDGINYLNLYLPNGYKVLVKVDSRLQATALIPISLAKNNPSPQFTGKPLDDRLKIAKANIRFFDIEPHLYT